MIIYYKQSWALATTRQYREAEKLALVALSLIFRILSRCRCRKEILSLIGEKSNMVKAGKVTTVDCKHK